MCIYIILGYWRRAGQGTVTMTIKPRFKSTQIRCIVMIYYQYGSDMTFENFHKLLAFLSSGW